MNKKELLEHLKLGIVTVTFKKVSDDSLRRMKCSLSRDYIGIQEQTKVTNNNKKKNDDVVPVWDVDKKAWRSFRMDKIIEVEIDENS